MNHWFTWENGQFLPIFFHRYVCWLASSSHPHWPALTRAHAPRAPAPRARAAWDCYAWGQPRSEKMKHAVYAGYIYIYTGWWFQPLWKKYSQLGLLSPRYGKIKKESKPPTSIYHLNGGFLTWEYPKMDDLWKTLLKWVIWGYPYFRRHSNGFEHWKKDTPTPNGF